MMTADEIADLIEEMVDARSRRDSATVIGLLDGLLRRPRADSLNVALTLAGTIGDGAELGPGETFHQLRVVVTDGEQKREGSADDLPPYIATFARMVVALNNNDRDMARDLFLGFVGDDGRRALQVLIFGLNQVLHSFGACSCQQGARP